MKNKIVDSHCHLDFNEFEDDLPEIIENAKSNDVDYMLSISVDFKNFENIHNIAKKFKNIWCTTGVHPNNVPKSVNESDLEELEINLKTNLKEQKVVGLGETGLDYFRGQENKENQVKYFKTHLKVSEDTGAPVIVHTRSAEDDTVKILNSLKQENKVKGIIHCFTSTKEVAEAALNEGFYISLAGIITFKNASEIVDIVRYIPLDKLLVETDSPFLSPEPYRGKRNQPSYVKFTLQKLAEIKKISHEEMAEITTRNFFNLFSNIKL